MKRVTLTIVAALALAYPRVAFAVQPIGYLDNAGCDYIAGWAQDPDVPNTPIDVHIYMGGPAGSGAPAAVINANTHRDDLCAAIGSCAHGYYQPTPFSLHDGQPREVYAYGIDNAGEGNPTLGNSPRTLLCAPAAQSGIRRKIDGVPAFEAWKFSSFWDLLPLAAPEAEQLLEGMDLPVKPELVQADDGSAEVYLVDHGVRRLISASDAAAWRFDVGSAEKRPAAEVQALALGTPLRPRPILFVHGGLYLVDDPQSFVTMPNGSSSSSSSSSGGEGGDDLGPDDVARAGMCTLSIPGLAGNNSFYMAILLAVWTTGWHSRRRLTVGAQSSAR